jgi:hypothetical protein
MQTVTMSLTEFLLARIAEDEAAWWGVTLGPRKSAECEAKRRVVGRAIEAEAAAGAWTHERLKADARSPLPEWSRRDACVEAAADLAAVYSDHPDYRDEWRTGEPRKFEDDAGFDYRKPRT